MHSYAFQPSRVTCTAQLSGAPLYIGSSKSVFFLVGLTWTAFLVVMGLEASLVYYIEAGVVCCPRALLLQRMSIVLGWLIQVWQDY